MLYTISVLTNRSGFLAFSCSGVVSLTKQVTMGKGKAELKEKVAQAKVKRTEAEASAKEWYSLH